MSGTVLFGSPGSGIIKPHREQIGAVDIVTIPRLLAGTVLSERNRPAELPLADLFHSYFSRPENRILTSMQTPQGLDRKAVSEFRDIFREEFGLTLSESEAQRLGSEVLRLFDLLLRNPKVGVDNQGDSAD